MRWRWREEEKFIEIGKNFVVAAPWSKTEKTKITLTEGMAFGTGVHETTISCIELLEGLGLNNKTVLDVGGGTGILSVCASKLGAKKVVAFDIDKKAAFECKKNAELNNANNIYCFCGENLCIREKYNIIMANIFAEIIISLSSEIDEHIKENGFLVLSGIVYDKNYDVKSTFMKKGYIVCKNTFLEDYTSFLLKKVNR
ncbi:MAG: 50S ribosomal protein L11 methyltransferase [Campylobacterota bacterium]|nr:50S ribosomal protein L11 methyltransferase [Campylobacterota bacterium]